MRIAYGVRRRADSEESVFFPDASGAAAGNAAKNMVVVLFECAVVADDTSVNEGGELAVMDLPVADLAAFLVRIGHITASFKLSRFNSSDYSRRTVRLLFFPKNFHTPFVIKSVSFIYKYILPVNHEGCGLLVVMAKNNWPSLTMLFIMTIVSFISCGN